MKLICRIVIGMFALLYAAAFALFIIGTRGLFGVAPDPLSGIFLIPLGVPWLSILTGAPEAMLPWIGVLAPGVNLGILFVLCRSFRRHAGRSS